MFNVYISFLLIKKILKQICERGVNNLLNLGIKMKRHGK